jgi:dTDP-glucose pyrophosphorylase
VIGMVLAAGASSRLRPDTDALPKALLPVAGDTTILDIALRNLAAVGLRDVVVVVVGHGRLTGITPTRSGLPAGINGSTSMTTRTCAGLARFAGRLAA